MKKVVCTLLLLSFYNLLCPAQNKDDIFVAYLVQKSAEKLEYDVYANCFEGNKVEPIVLKLIQDGRFVVSVVRTKSGILVLHRPNTEGMEQAFALVAPERLKEVCNHRMKSGFSLYYYNDDGDFALFRKNPSVTKQEVVSKLTQAQLNKWNKKGMYAVIQSRSLFVLQNGGTGIVEQFVEEFPSLYRLQCDSFFTRTNHGCIPVSLFKNYRYSDNSTAYGILYNHCTVELEGNQQLKEFRTEKELADFLSKQGSYGYKLRALWGGWTAQTYSGVQNSNLNGSYVDED